MFISSDLFTYPVTWDPVNVLKWTPPFKQWSQGFLFNWIHLHKQFYVKILCFIQYHNWERNTAQCFSLYTAFSQILHEGTVDSLVNCSSLKHKAPLWRSRICQCTLLRYIFRCELQPFTEAFSRSQWSSVQCINLLKGVFVFSWHWFQCTYRLIVLQN